MFKLLPITFIILHGVQSMINGLYAEPGDFPFVVAIHRLNSHYCSGILINDLKVLTVGHTMDVMADPIELLVIVGHVSISNVLFDRSVTYPVKSVYRHPEFAQYIPDGANEPFFLNDIAVLKLRYRVRDNPYVGWANLMNAEAPWGPQADCSIISWSRGPQERMRLMWDKVKYVDDEVNNLWAMYLLPNQKSFNDLFDHDFISSDDIGSPIVCNNQVIGLVVKGGRLDYPTKPSILLLIYNYLEFIWEIMADGLFDIRPWTFPYVATIWKLQFPQCGGVIMTERHIVTTGSCSEKIDTMNGSVTVGYTNIEMDDPDINWLSIENIVKHPMYNVRAYFWPTTKPPNDIAVIVLAGSLVWSPTVQPVTIGESDNFVGGEVCQVLRWLPHPVTHWQKARKIARLTLKRSLVVIWDERQLDCIMKSPEHTSIWGRTPYLMPIAERIDSGNPLICAGYTVGMVLQDSKPKNWNGAKSARFVKIRQYLHFINTVIGVN